MSVSIRFPAALLLAAFACAAARSQLPPELQQPAAGVQQPAVPDVQPLTGPDAPAGLAQPGPTPPPAYTTTPGPTPPSLVPDDWMMGTGPRSCYCPIGGNGPIQTELYLRAGPDFPVGGGIYDRILNVGWEIQGGGRGLFFNNARNAAWVADLGIVNQYNYVGRSDVTIPISVPVTTTNQTTGQPSTTNQTVNTTGWYLNRTYVSGSLGKEWWLFGPATACGRHWRWGADVGGRYGSEDATFHEIRHRTATTEAAFTALHSDLEWCCCGCCTCVAGLRLEYDYTFSQRILQSTNNGNVADLTLLLTVGVRF